MVRYSKAGIPIALIVTVVGIWYYWPSINYRNALGALNGSAEGDEWGFSMNTFANRISSDDVAGFYSHGTKRLLTLDSESKTYTYEDSMGYMGCITVSQHPESYEYVKVFGGNDSDLIFIGRAFGNFPQEQHKNVAKITGRELPDGIIRPW